jgi:hypothetical protein
MRNPLFVNSYPLIVVAYLAMSMVNLMTSAVIPPTTPRLTVND